jgi:hypothetical protein
MYVYMRSLSKRLDMGKNWQEKVFMYDFLS